MTLLEDDSAAEHQHLQHHAPIKTQNVGDWSGRHHFSPILLLVLSCE